MKQTSQALQTALRSQLALLILAASLVIAPLAPVTHATGSKPAEKLCSKARHPEREITYDETRMKITFTFDIERCMKPGHLFYHVQAKIFRTDIMGFGMPAGTGKLCDPKPTCRLSLSLDHDPIEIRSEYVFEADYTDRQDRSVVNHMGPYYCTSLPVYQHCLTEDP